MENLFITRILGYFKSNKDVRLAIKEAEQISKDFDTRHMCIESIKEIDTALHFNRMDKNSHLLREDRRKLKIQLFKRLKP